MSYDIVVIGGGPGGYVAAIRAAQLGAKVAVVEKDQLGGTCLNRGCIPTKALVATVEKIQSIQEASEFGIAVSDYEINFEKVQQRKNEVVERLVKGIHFLFKKNKIDLISGTATIKATNEVEVNCEGGTKNLSCKNIIIATGSSPAIIRALGYDGENIITSEEALELKEIPQSLLIVGAGVIGCEFANIYQSMGTQVTMVEAMPTILPMLDKEISRRMQSAFKKREITIKTKIKIKEIKKSAEGIEAILENDEKITAEKALISIGRELNTSGLGLEKIGVETNEKGAILVNDKMETNVGGIYAIGDVTDKLQLAHVASAQGIVAAENIMGKDRKMNYSAVPNCIFTSPEIASVGITTEIAKEKNIPVNTGKFNFLASGKALCMGESEGLVKIIAHKDTDVVLGVHIMGPHASDLIAEATLAVEKGLTVTDLTTTIHAHPTLAETIMEAAEAVHDMSIHG
ncbi:MAG: dihydrolipoamide dehydrogenase [Clostridia bacterium]|jgi:dihydrolipoamide dehydrogenase|nr:dihydrolipoamide dehydrogenase [Clostridia bacterium]